MGVGGRGCKAVFSARLGQVYVNRQQRGIALNYTQLERVHDASPLESIQCVP